MWLLVFLQLTMAHAERLDLGTDGINLTAETPFWGLSMTLGAPSSWLAPRQSVFFRGQKTIAEARWVRVQAGLELKHARQESVYLFRQPAIFSLQVFMALPVTTAVFRYPLSDTLALTSSLSFMPISLQFMYGSGGNVGLSFSHLFMKDQYGFHFSWQCIGLEWS